MPKTGGIQPGHAAIFERPFTRLIQGHDVCTAQTKVRRQWPAFLVLLPFDRNAHNPTPRTGRINHKIQTVAVAMPPSAKVLNLLLCQIA